MLSGITIEEDNYIYPPRTKSVMPIDQAIDFLKDLNWLAQYKYNDTRCMIKIINNSIQLWGRHGERLKYYPTAELQEELEVLQKILPGHCLLDGGLLNNKHAAIKDTLVLWDILVVDGQHLVGESYETRYNIVSDICSDSDFEYKNPDKTDFLLGKLVTPHIFVPHSFSAKQPTEKEHEWWAAWNTVERINQYWLNNKHGPLLEGLVFKNPSAPLEFGFKEINNSSWMIRSRVKTRRHNF